METGATPNPSTILDAALKYLDKGISVIPVKGQAYASGKDEREKYQDGKKPLLTSWKPFQTRLATTEEVKGWFQKWPKAQLAIVTGELSKLLVIDTDTEEAWGWLQDQLPDGLLTPVAKTPRVGFGRQTYLSYPEGCGLTIGTDGHPEIKGLDYRAEGGYVLVPPSVNVRSYEWLDGLSLDEVQPADPGAPFIVSLKNVFKHFSYIGREGKDRPQETTTTTNDHKNGSLFLEGNRDETLFHIAFCLARSGNPKDHVMQTLMVLGRNCTPPFPDREIIAKVESALKRIAQRDGSIAEEVRQWVTTTNGYFTTTNCHKQLQTTTKEDIKAVNMALSRMALGPDAIIERVGRQAGTYRLIERDAEEIDFLNAPDNEFKISLPLDLSDYCIVYPGSPLVFAGAKSAGKTAAAIEIIKRNMKRYPVLYLTSELHGTELKKRLLKHTDLTLKDWKFKAYRRSHDWADLVTGEEKIWVIDYIEEVESEAWKVGAHIKAVHDKLDKGVAVIFLQKKGGFDVDLARGGSYTLDKARLYVALDKGRAKIVDCKAFRGENPNGMIREFKLVQGARFLPQGDWHE